VSPFAPAKGRPFARAKGDTRRVADALFLHLVDPRLERFFAAAVAGDCISFSRAQRVGDGFGGHECERRGIGFGEFGSIGHGIGESGFTSVY